MARTMRGAAVLALVAASQAAYAQERADDNAVTQAEDGFGFSVGRESLGIYSGGNTRGFSPTAAGNVRIDGLYFDSAGNLSGQLIESTAIRVGLSAQGYPFTAPSGVLDVILRKPGNRAGASLVVNGDSYGTVGADLTGALPLAQGLSVGFGLGGGSTHYPDGTDNTYSEVSAMLRWRPSARVEVMPFYARYRDFQDETGEFYIPAAKVLPAEVRTGHFFGPHWANFNFVSTTAGVLASAAPAKNWVVRLGAFRSKTDQQTSFANLLVDIQPDGSADRLIIADPRQNNYSNSGELRVTHSVTEGPRLHVFHASLRERDAQREYGGSQVFDLGPTVLGTDVTAPAPDAYAFSALTRDRVRQTTPGFAYEGRWKGVGELGFSLAKAWYSKTTTIPGVGAITSRAQPWLYNASLALRLGGSLTAFAGLARGLEDSGLAPTNAANRNSPLPAKLTRQHDAGLRLALGKRMKFVAGVFDLTKPYFGFDAAQTYRQIGSIRSQGAEFSLSGAITPKLNLVAAGYFLRPRVERDAAAIGVIGSRPVGLASHLVNVNLAWQTPLKGFALDAAAFLRGSVPGTTDNVVIVPDRNTVNAGARYRFKAGGKNATLRLQVTNMFGTRGFQVAGPGIYGATPGRAVNGFLAIDL